MTPLLLHAIAFGTIGVLGGLFLGLRLGAEAAFKMEREAFRAGYAEGRNHARLDFRPGTVRNLKVMR